MKVNLIALDLDGTLLRNDKTVSEYTRSVLERCKQQGILVAVATARSEDEAEKFIRWIQPDILISNGGALVRRGEKILYTAALSADTADSMLRDALRQPGFLSATVQTASEYLYYGAWDPLQLDDSGYRSARYRDLSQPLGQTALKITLQSASLKEMEQLAKNYSECCMFPFAGEDWYRFAHKDATKFQAVAAAARACDIPLTEVAAFGDDLIDLEMLRGCGIGIAMGNAIPEVQTAADFVCDTNENDGVAKWLAEHMV